MVRMILAMIISGSLMSASCSRKMDPLPQKLCEGVICTANFAMITITATDANGQPIVLDDFYTLRSRTGEKIKSQQSLSNGTFVVLDDGYQKNLANQSEEFRFVGIKGSTRVMDESFRISADCCHVKKESGNTTIVVK